MTTCSPTDPAMTFSRASAVPGLHAVPPRDARTMQRVPAHRADTAPGSSRTLKGLSVLLGTALLVTGCSVPGLPGATGAPASMERAAVQDPAADAEPAADSGGDPEEGDSPTSTTEPEDGPEAQDPVEETWVPVKADLDHGSVTHELPAAARTIVIDYWTEDDMSRLTPESRPIIRMNARIDGPDDGTLINVTRFNAQVQSLGVDLANDTGSFAINPPYSYMTAVALPANPTAHSTEVLVTFDLLTETTPGSGTFTRQTVLDTVSLGYALPPVAAK